MKDLRLNKLQYTALHYAIASNVQVIETLLNRTEVAANTLNTGKMSALLYLVLQDEPNVAEALPKDARVDPNIPCLSPDKVEKIVLYY